MGKNNEDIKLKIVKQEWKKGIRKEAVIIEHNGTWFSRGNASHLTAGV